MKRKVISIFACILLIATALPVLKTTQIDEKENKVCTEDSYRLGECVGAIATGTVCKDGMSIIFKNRHIFPFDFNQNIHFYEGVNYTYFGIGAKDDPYMCRMGQNEKGLALVNFDFYIPLESVTGHSDGSSENEDDDFHSTLGQFATVKNTATFLARHSNFSGQYLIISSEPGVGAIVSIDGNKSSHILWVNNSYAAVANTPYCDGVHDDDGTDLRATEIMDDIVNNGTSSDGDNLLNWKDLAQRVAKDTSDKEDGEGAFSCIEEISNMRSCSSIVSVAGNSSFNESIHMSWVNLGATTQIGIFLPIYAGNLHSIEDIPSWYIKDNDGAGVAPYVKPKYKFARAGLGVTGEYHCDRVRHIQKYTHKSENITFDAFDNLTDAIMSSTDENEVRLTLATFVNDTLPVALNGYIAMPEIKSKQSVNRPFFHFLERILSNSPFLEALLPNINVIKYATDYS